MPRLGNSKKSMQIDDRIRAFSELGSYMEGLSQEIGNHELLERAKHHNGWFSNDNLFHALSTWSQLLKETTLKEWAASYTLHPETPKKVAVVMAGNIPLVGFHDFLSVLLSGHKIVAKLSSNDTILLPHLAEKLIELEPSFARFIEFPKGQLQGFDAVIATGSNNTARYFEHYFGKFPNIIRKNRNGVAVLSGDESEEDLLGLANDIFRYFGLGCRNVSKLFVPKDYDFANFFKAMFHWKELINNDKYINNYDYNKAVYLMSDVSLLDNEFMLLKEDTNYSSPIAVVFYEYYESLPLLQKQLNHQAESIQCVVGNSGIQGEIPFGTAQTPTLFQYADGIDTLAFLSQL